MKGSGLFLNKYNDPSQSGHSIFNTFNTLHAYPSLLAFIIFLCLYLSTGKLLSFIRNSQNMSVLKNIHSINDPGLTYLETLTKKQRKQIIKNETENREKYGYSKIDDDVFEKIKTIHAQRRETGEDKRDRTFMIGLPTYEIIENPRYKNKFQYVPDSGKEEKDYVTLSEYVKKQLDRFYL